MKRTITKDVFSCNLCRAECAESDRNIKIQIHPGDGRDVGPSYIIATMHVYMAYGASGEGTHLCAACKGKWLREYVANLEVGS